MGQMLAYFKILVVSEYLIVMKIECLVQITKILYTGSRKCMTLRPV